MSSRSKVKIVFRHTPAASMEYCQVINEDVSYRVCAVLCKKRFKCAMKWKGKKKMEVS